jgi:hypothetical protein
MAKDGFDAEAVLKIVQTRRALTYRRLILVLTEGSTIGGDLIRGSLFARLAQFCEV